MHATFHLKSDVNIRLTTIIFRFHMKQFYMVKFSVAEKCFGQYLITLELQMRRNGGMSTFGSNLLLSSDGWKFQQQEEEYGGYFVIESL